MQGYEDSMNYSYAPPTSGSSEPGYDYDYSRPTDYTPLTSTVDTYDPSPTLPTYDDPYRHLSSTTTSPTSTSSYPHSQASSYDNPSYDYYNQSSSTPSPYNYAPRSPPSTTGPPSPYGSHPSTQQTTSQSPISPYGRPTSQQYPKSYRDYAPPSSLPSPYSTPTTSIITPISKPNIPTQNRTFGIPLKAEATMKKVTSGPTPTPTTFTQKQPLLPTPTSYSSYSPGPTQSGPFSPTKSTNGSFSRHPSPPSYYPGMPIPPYQNYTPHSSYQNYGAPSHTPFGSVNPSIFQTGLQQPPNWIWSDGRQAGDVRQFNKNKWPKKVTDPEKILTPVIQCTLCDKVVSNTAFLKEHVASQKHLAKFKNATMDLTTGTTKELEEPLLRCILCKVSIVAVEKVEEHLQSAQHSATKKRKRQEEKAIAADPSKKLKAAGVTHSGGSYTCTTCGVVSNTLSAVLSHIDGRKHQKAVARAEGKKEQTPTQPTKPQPTIVAEAGEMFVQDPTTLIVECKICSISLHSQSVYESHIKGKKHTNKAKQEAWRLYKANPVSFVSPENPDSKSTPYVMQPSTTSSSSSSSTTSISTTTEKKLTPLPSIIKIPSLPLSKLTLPTTTLPVTSIPIKIPPLYPTLLLNSTFDVNDLKCEICAISCPTPKLKQQHDQSNKHKRTVEIETLYQAQLAKGISPPTKERPFPCEVCKLWFTKSEFDAHLAGKKHAAVVRGEVDDGKDPRKCDVCTITLIGPHAFERHLKSKRHLQNLQIVEPPPPPPATTTTPTTTN